MVFLFRVSVKRLMQKVLVLSVLVATLRYISIGFLAEQIFMAVDIQVILPVLPPICQ